MAVQTGVYRGVSAEDRLALRRARLLEATLAVWASPDTSTTMTGVCAEAGLTERYFYESFKNLDEARTAVLDTIAAEIEQRTLEAAVAAGDDPAVRVRATMVAFVQLLAEDPRKGRVAIIEAGALPALRHRRTELMRYFARLSAEVAREIYDLPQASARDTELGGLLFVGGVAELVTAWLDGAVDATTDEIVDASARMFAGLHR